MRLDRQELERRIADLEKERDQLRAAIVQNANYPSISICEFCRGGGYVSMSKQTLRRHLVEEFHKPFTWDSLVEAWEQYRNQLETPK